VNSEITIQLAIYRSTAQRGRPPSLEDVARGLDVAPAEVREAFARLAARRLLVLEPDGVTIRMAPPFSGVPTQHRVIAGGVEYFANCAWDALGIPAALHREAEIHSRCEQSLAPLMLRVGADGPEPSSWLFHCEVPAARWWSDIVFT
jgi:hypothetical protein